MTLVMGGRLQIVEGSEGGLRREVTLTVYKLELSLNIHGPLLRRLFFLNYLPFNTHEGIF